MGHKIHIHLNHNFDKSLAPIPATKHRHWWDDNHKTKDHAKHCLPLSMANSLGYYILSPGTFLVKWNGNIHEDAEIEHIDKSSHYIVDNHAAYGSFTVQPQFIPVTEDPGDFVYIKGVANERSLPYSCMEAAIEAWWSVGNFGLVFLCNQPGEFIVYKGQPIAQMFLLSAGHAATDMDFVDGFPAEHYEWQKKRSRPDYRKDLDYFVGKTHQGAKVDSHITSWSQAEKYRENHGK